MTKKKNQNSKTNKEENSLADIVRSAMIGTQQVPSILKRGNNFCISGLLINHFAPDINIEGDSWSGITTLVNRYPTYFSDESYSSGSYYGEDIIQEYVHNFKQYYRETKRINLKLLVSINDTSFGMFKPFTFTDFANLFEEIGIKIEKLDPITKYNEDNVLTLNNLQIIEEDKPLTSFEPSFSNPFSNSNVIIQNMNINLDPKVLDSIISNYVANMLSKQRIGARWETPKPSKDIIKTEQK